MKQDTKLGVSIILFIAAAIFAILGQATFTPVATSDIASVTPAASDTPTSEPTPSATKSSKPKPVVLNYWTNAIDAEDVSNTVANDKTCTFDMCVFVKITAKHDCSAVGLDGDIYDINDELFDSFSSEYKGLKKGQSRIVELGDDAIDESEDYVELSDATCYK